MEGRPDTINMPMGDIARLIGSLEIELMVANRQIKELEEQNRTLMEAIAGSAGKEKSANGARQSQPMGSP